MVDQQTPSVRSQDELDREEVAPREVRKRRDDNGDLEVEANRRAQSAEEEPLVRSDRASTTDASAGGRDANLALFDDETSRDLRERWLNIQTEFVDSPKRAVEKAESLVGEVMQQLTDGFARQRRELESGWSGTDETTTEDLRLAIRRYRSFFNRLLTL